MDHLNQREQAFLETVKAWMDQPNTELYLAGTVRGRIDLEEDIERFTIRDDASMSQPLVEALKEMGAKDLRVGPEATLNLMTQMTKDHKFLHNFPRGFFINQVLNWSFQLGCGLP